MNRRFLYPLLIAVAGLAAYANSFGCPFIFDDYVHIIQDERLRGGLLHLLRYSMRPPVALSLWVNHRLGGTDLFGYHAVNLSVHLLAALALFGIVRRTLQSARLRDRHGERAEGLAAAIALLWAVHPLQTMSVTYIIQRAESMMGLFYLLTLYCLIRSGEAGRPVTWWLAAVLACLLGTASKAVMVTAPVVALLYDRVFMAGSWREALRRRWPLYLGLCATWAVPALIFGGHPDVYGPEVGFGMKKVSAFSYALTQSGVVLHYLRLSLWPNPLVLDYGWPLVGSVREALPALAAVGAGLSATLWALWRRPAAGFLGAWFFLLLAPTSSFIPVLDPAFEYRMYLPLAAVVTAVVMGADAALRRLFHVRYFVWKAGPAFVVLAALALGAATLRRNHDYRSVLSIWEDTVRKRPLSSRAHSNHGAALHIEGRVKEAVEEYREALRLEPDYADGHNNLAYSLEGLGQHEEAAAEFEETLRLEPRHPRAKRGLAMVLRNRGLVLQAEGKNEEALARYRRALELDPEDASLNNNIGTLAFQRKEWEEAQRWFAEAARLDPRHIEAQNNLGAALEMQGKLEQAISHYEQALKLKPGYASARANLERARDRARVPAARRVGEGSAGSPAGRAAAP